MLKRVAQLSDWSLPRSFAPYLVLLAALVFLAFPYQSAAALSFALRGLVNVAPIVLPGVLLAAWIVASGADASIARAFNGQTAVAIIAASAIGAVTPVCGITVLPLMAGLLASGVPLAPIMAFWLSSPVTDPAMLATTAATLGADFAVGKTVAAFVLGLWGGAVTSLFASRQWSLDALRANRIVGNLSCSSCDSVSGYMPKFWRDPARITLFRARSLATTRLIIICLIPAFIAEYWLNALLSPDALTPYVGRDAWWAVPFAVFIGAPAYFDGFAALPLTRSLLDHGMSPGAALAFLVSGGVISVWGAIAIFPVLKLKPFLLYIALAVTGSLAVGYTFDFLV